MAEDSDRQSRRDHWMESIVATLLGLATLASAWCGTQSVLWSGIQTFRLDEANKLSRAASQKTTAIGQNRALDVFIFERYLTATHDGNKRLADFFVQRFPPALRIAVDAWLATRPLENPEAPRTPFQMKEYVPAGTQEVELLRAQEAKAFEAAKAANEISDSYMRMTVLFGLALFLAGVSGFLRKNGPRIAVIGMSTVATVSGILMLIRLPLAAE